MALASPENAPAVLIKTNLASPIAKIATRTITAPGPVWMPHMQLAILVSTAFQVRSTNSLMISLLVVFVPKASTVSVVLNTLAPWVLTRQSKASRSATLARLDSTAMLLKVLRSLLNVQTGITALAELENRFSARLVRILRPTWRVSNPSNNALTALRATTAMTALSIGLKSATLAITVIPELLCQMNKAESAQQVSTACKEPNYHELVQMVSIHSQEPRQSSTARTAALDITASDT